MKSEASSFRRNLFLASPMMRGEDVFALQRALQRRGAAVTCDGFFGLATQLAVRAFQARAGLVDDGVCGPATWAGLFDADGSGAGRIAGALDPRARQCLQTLRSLGFNDAQACGIIGNIEVESRFDPAATGDSNTAYGLAQWHPDRQTAFSRRYGRPMAGSSGPDQLRFIHHEMTEGEEQQAGRALAAAATARAAGEIVSLLYERPRDRHGQARLRGERADAYHAVLVGGTPSPASAPELPQTPPFRTADSILGPEQFRALMQPHRLFRDSIAWKLTETGIATDGASAAAASQADLALVQQVLTEQHGLLLSLSADGRVPIELVLAALCVARPLGGATRTGYGADIRFPGRTPDCVSAGCMQTTLSLARIALNRPTLTADELRQPETSIRAGTAVMWLHAAETRFDPPLVAAMYTTGVLRHDLRSRWRLFEYPIIATDYVSRFVRSFNAAIQAQVGASLPPATSQFRRMFDGAFSPATPPRSGAYVAPNPAAWIGKPPVPPGQCVALVQKAAGAPATALWRPGPFVQGIGGQIAPGTAIATFDPDGRYGNHTDGRSHAALFLEERPDGILVVDQWVHQPPHQRPIRYRNTQGHDVNRGEAFRVIV